MNFLAIISIRVLDFHLYEDWKFYSCALNLDFQGTCFIQCRDKNTMNSWLKVANIPIFAYWTIFTYSNVGYLTFSNVRYLGEGISTEEEILL